MAEQLKMWAAKRDGKLVYWSVALMKSDVISKLLDAFPHETPKSLRGHGYRCIRVKVVEVEGARA